VAGDTESIASKDDHNFFTQASNDKDGGDSQGIGVKIQMDLVHQDTAKTAGVATEGK
jgi:hypothetical protein